MRLQPAFDFTAPPIVAHPSAPRLEIPPVGGDTPMTRYASGTGALAVLQSRGEKAAALLQLFRNHGPLTLNEAATITGYPLSSVCSLKKAIKADLEEVDHELVAWGNGKITKRTRWRGLRTTRSGTSPTMPPDGRA